MKIPFEDWVPEANRPAYRAYLLERDEAITQRCKSTRCSGLTSLLQEAAALSEALDHGALPSEDRRELAFCAMLKVIGREGALIEEALHRLATFQRLKALDRNGATSPAQADESLRLLKELTRWALGL